MKKKFVAVTVFVLTFVVSVTSQTLTTGGEVVEVLDGKTMIVASPNGHVKVELQFIEVPEPAQQMHAAAREHLHKLVAGKVVEYRPLRLYAGVTVGRVTLNHVDISQQMLRDGAAWHMPFDAAGQPLAEYREYAMLEAAAKSESRGVWSITGLKPAWEFRAAQKANRALSANLKNPTAIQPSASAVKRTRPAGYWGDVNPLMGEIGPLTHGYNAKSRLGYLSTSWLGVEQSEEDKANDAITAMDFTFWYREDPLKGRAGMFVVTLISRSKEHRFAKNNDLVLMGEKTHVIGKAKRVASTDGDIVTEKLTYEVQRADFERIVYGIVIFKVSNRMIEPRGFAYSIFHNMFQLAGKTQLASAEKPKSKQ